MRVMICFVVVSLALLPVYCGELRLCGAGETGHSGRLLEKEISPKNITVVEAETFEVALSRLLNSQRTPFVVKYAGNLGRSGLRGPIGDGANRWLVRQSGDKPGLPDIYGYVELTSIRRNSSGHTSYGMTLMLHKTLLKSNVERFLSIMKELGTFSVTRIGGPKKEAKGVIRTE